MRYEDIDALNWSTLKHLETAPKKLKHLVDNPDENDDKESFRLGRAEHCAILEPDEFSERYVVSPIFGTTKVELQKKIDFYEQFWSPNWGIEPDFGDIDKMDGMRTKMKWLKRQELGVEVISQAEYDTAWRCADAVRSHKVASAILKDAVCEEVIQWTDESTGIKCKGRIDIRTDRIVDIKSTRRDNTRQIIFDASQYNYHGQVSWYHDGAVSAGKINGRVLPAAIFVHATRESKYVDVAVLDMALCPITFEEGQALYQSLIDQYAGCQVAKWWPGMAETSIPWELTGWKKA